MSPAYGSSYNNLNSPSPTKKLFSESAKKLFSESAHMSSSSEVMSMHNSLTSNSAASQNSPIKATIIMSNSKNMSMHNSSTSNIAASSYSPNKAISMSSSENSSMIEEKKRKSLLDISVSTDFQFALDRNESSLFSSNEGYDDAGANSKKWEPLSLNKSKSLFF